MRNSFQQHYEYWRVWLRTLFCVLLIIIAWIIYGGILELPFFDDDFFKFLKVLEKNLTLAFVAATLGLQIPLFILFLQTMKRSGYVYKKVLPEITEFREIVIVLFFTTLLLLISPKNSYLYLPTIVFVLINLIAIFRAANIIFNLENIHYKVIKALKSTVKNTFNEALDDRIRSNNLIEWIEKQKYIHHSFLKKELDNSLIISSTQSGYVNRIDYKTLGKLYKKITKKRFWQKEAKNTEVCFDIHSMVNTKVSAGDDLMFVSNTSQSLPKKYIKRFRKAFVIADKSSSLKSLESILNEFDESLTKGVQGNNAKLVSETLDLFRSVADQLDELVLKRMVHEDQNYSLKEAHGEITERLLSDSLGQIIRRVYEIYSENIIKGIKVSNYETTDLIISEVSRYLLNNRKAINYSAISRNERILYDTLARFIYDTGWNNKLTGEQTQIRDELLKNIEEITSMLYWLLKWETRASKAAPIMEERLKSSFERIRELTLSAYKNEKFTEFNHLAELLLRIDEDPFDELTHLKDLVAMNILIVSVYLRYRNDLSSEYGDTLLQRLMKWPHEKLTRIAIMCVSDNLADTWRINMLDIFTDGLIHSVPDLNSLIRRSWLEVIGHSAHVSDEVESYGNEGLFQGTFFFTNGASSNSNVEILKMLEDLTSPSKDSLRTIVKKFIDIRRNYERQIIQSASLDQTKISGFNTAANKGYKEASLMLKVFNKPSLYKVDSSTNGTGFKQIGVSRIFEKEAFLEEWHAGYATDHYANDLGSTIAQYQDQSIFSKILDDAQKINDLTELLRYVKSYRGEWVVLINKAFNYELRQTINDILTPDSSYNKQFIAGIKQTLPIQRVYLKDIPGGLYFVKKSQVGKVTRKKETSNDNVEVDIAAYSDDVKLTDGLINAKPDWLLDKGDEMKQREFLNTKVQLWVMHIFKYDPNDSRDVVYFPINQKFQKSFSKSK